MVRSYVADAYSYTDGVPALVGDIVTKSRDGAEWKILAISTFTHSGAERVALESHTGKRVQRTGAGLHELQLVRRAADDPARPHPARKNTL